MEVKRNVKRLLRDSTRLHGFEKECAQVRDLFIRTAKEGESNSALLIGQKLGGKTTLVNSVLNELLQDEIFVANSVTVVLDGVVHTDDRAALKSTTKQLKLEDKVDGKVFNSFSENLLFLLTCLKAGQDRQRLIFIIENFELFCAHHNQALLYNLFDVAQSAQTPVCILGITSRLDIVELLEKRVKSRFSHRQIFLRPDTANFDVLVLKSLLRLPSQKEFVFRCFDLPNLQSSVQQQFNLPCLRTSFTAKKYSLKSKQIDCWNKSIDELVENEKVARIVEKFFNLNASIATLKMLLFEVVSIADNKSDLLSVIDPDKFVGIFEAYLSQDPKVNLICGLTVLEVCLLIAIKHHCEIYDNDPFNFEIIFTRFNKFALKSSTMQNIERGMALMRFDNLRHQEFIASFGADVKVQKEHQMYKFLLFDEQIQNAVQKYENLPTEIEQWCKSSLI